MTDKRFTLAAVLGCLTFALWVASPSRSEDATEGTFADEPAERLALLVQKESGKADEAKADESKREGAAKDPGTPVRKFRRRLPNYYGQIGITQAQRLKIYSIQEGYFTKIVELERQLAALQAQRDKEIEDVLTPDQKDRLEKALDAAEKRRKSRRSKSTAGRKSPGE